MKYLYRVTHEYFEVSKIRRETFWAYAAKLISVCAGAVMLIVIPRLWGVDIYGQFILFIAYISIIEIGFGNSINAAIKREVSSIGLGSELSNLVRQGLLVKLVFFVFGLSILTSSIYFFPDSLISNYFYYFVVLMFLMNFWGFVVNFFEAAHKLYHEFVMYVIQYSSLLLLLLYLYLSDNLDFEKLIIIFIISYFLSFVYGVLKLFKYLDFKNTAFTYNPLFTRELLFRTFNLALVSVSYVLLTRIDLIIISFFFSSVEVGYYGIAAEISKNLTIFSIAFSLGVIPLLVKEENSHLFSKTIRSLVVLNVLIFASVFLSAPYLIELIYGQGYSQTVLLLQILGILPLFLSLQNFTSEILILQNKTRTLLLNGFVAVVINVVLSVWMVQLLGMSGVAIATVVAYSIWFMLNLLSLMKYFSKG